jgi:hypothetical protein
MVEEPTAIVVVDGSWVKQVGLSFFFTPSDARFDPLTGRLQSLDPKAKEEPKFYVISVVNFNLSDGWFLEIEFDPSHISIPVYPLRDGIPGSKMKLFIPKQYVLAVLSGGDRRLRDVVVGFKPA